MFFSSVLVIPLCDTDCQVIVLCCSTMLFICLFICLFSFVSFHLSFSMCYLSIQYWYIQFVLKQNSQLHRISIKAEKWFKILCNLVHNSACQNHFEKFCQNIWIFHGKCFCVCLPQYQWLTYYNAFLETFRLLKWCA